MIEKNILLIDDDPELCGELADLLKQEGYTVDNTSDSQAGASLLQTNRYNLVLLDFKMPTLSGVDILKIISVKHIPAKAIIISGKPFVEKTLEDEHVADSVAAVISKPFNYTVLLTKIRQVLSVE